MHYTVCLASTGFLLSRYTYISIRHFPHDLEYQPTCIKSMKLSRYFIKKLLIYAIGGRTPSSRGSPYSTAYVASTERLSPPRWSSINQGSLTGQPVGPKPIGNVSGVEQVVLEVVVGRNMSGVGGCDSPEAFE